LFIHGFDSPIISNFLLSDGGRPKAGVAAAKLRSIFPGVVSQGVQLSIPMPGNHKFFYGLLKNIEAIRRFFSLCRSSNFSSPRGGSRKGIS
jgi:hypothetical protein